MRDILIVDLYNAIEENNPNIIKNGLAQFDFEKLIEEYLEMQSGDNTVLELKIKTLSTKIAIGASCLIVLETKIADEEMMSILNQNGFKIDKDNYPYDLIAVAKKLEGLTGKLKRLETALPNSSKKKKKNDGIMTIYDVIASMGSGLELYLDPRKLSVVEFISYRKVLDSRAKTIKNRDNGIK